MLVAIDRRASPEQFFRELCRLPCRLRPRVAHCHDLEAVQAYAAQCGISAKVATAHSPATDEGGAQAVHAKPRVGVNVAGVVAPRQATRGNGRGLKRLVGAELAHLLRTCTLAPLFFLPSAVPGVQPGRGWALPSEPGSAFSVCRL